jgi:hypothetical protein
MEGERELLINLLQGLADRQCLLSTAALETLLVETPYVPDSFYAYVAENLPAVLLAMQRDRLQAGERIVRLEPVRLLPAAPASAAEPTASPMIIDVEVLRRSEEVISTATKEAGEREVIVVRPLEDDDPFLD